MKYLILACLLLTNFTNAQAYSGEPSDVYVDEKSASVKVKGGEILTHVNPEPTKHYYGSLNIKAEKTTKSFLGDTVTTLKIYSNQLRIFTVS